MVDTVEALALMGCCEIEPGVYVCRPSDQTVTPARRRPIRGWCFKCRKRHVHRAFVIAALWYDPQLFWKCDGCGADNRQFGCA